MKKIRKFLQDLRKNEEAEISFEISYWHFVIIGALIAFTIYTCN